MTEKKRTSSPVEDTGLYPPESQNLNIVEHLEELRRRILACLGWLVLLSVLFFSRSRLLLEVFKSPLGRFADNLIFISPTEVFVASVKVSVLAALIVCFPIILYEVWAFLSPAFPRRSRMFFVGWLLLAVGCFSGGLVFSWTVAIPAALGFLLNFGAGVARASITVGRYVSFVAALVLMGGCVFEIPVVAGILTEWGVLNPRAMMKSRKYALLVILVLAAVLTPTQDIVNMLIFAVPMAVLYEGGILVSWLLYRKNLRGKD